MRQIYKKNQDLARYVRFLSYFCVNKTDEL